jgi:Fic-DOC domain mobile mystery protein B
MKILFEDLLPGETPIDDTSGLLVPGITTRRDLNIAEAKNIRKALVKYFARSPTPELAPFTFEWSINLHREMFGEVWSWAGIFRTSNFNIGVPFTQVQERLFNLLEDLHSWNQHGMEMVEQAARLHHVAVQIHPFVNGNGRWGRMLTNLWLAIQTDQYIEWPEVSIGSISPIRDEYLAALKAADAGDYDPFIIMHSDNMIKNQKRS